MKYFISDLKDLLNLLLNNATLITLIVILDALAWVLITGHYTSFLHPRFWPFLLAAIVIVILYITAIILGRPMQRNVYMSRKVVAFLVLLTPLFVLYTVVGQGMGVHAFSKKVINSDQSVLPYLKDLGVQEPGNKITNTTNEYSILDLLLKEKRLNGQRVITKGLTYTDSNVPKDHVLLFRFAMSCCAADATPLWILVKAEKLEPLENESWVRVEGVLKTSKIRGKDTSVIHAETIEKMETPSPGAQYIFF